MEFEKRKELAMATMVASLPDKSPKGTLDAPIVSLLDAINRHPSFFTTSSCSGRISILFHPREARPVAAAGENSTFDSQNTPEKEENKGEEKKKKKKKKAGGGGWLLVAHDPVDPQAVVDLLFSGGSTHSGPAQGTVVFRFEPFILAVECRDAASAQLLVSTAISCGFRESGITSLQKRVMVAIRCSIRLEVPLGEIGQMMISPEYVMYLAKIANEKMTANRKRTDLFLQALKCKNGIFLAANDCESGSTPVILDGKRDLSIFKVKHIEQLGYDAESCSGLYESDDKVFDTLLKSSKKSNFSPELDKVEDEATRSSSGLPRTPEFSVSVELMVIAREPIEKLFIWGHSANTLNKSNQSQILVFGGFGGLGRHARRNNTLLLEPSSGVLRDINAEGPPSPRLGHTSSIVGKFLFVVGGRGDPTQIFNDVWALDTVENKWMLLDCGGSLFHRRHRHAAAVVGSKVYVFGGLSNETVYSCMHVLDSETIQWNEVEIQGESPCARHSHAMAAHDSRLFLFGGFDGQKVLGDLYTFDIKMSLWSRLRTAGRTPFPRFSHSMFVYENYLGIIGGCPVKQHHQELALFHLVHHVWRYIIVDSVAKDLWVRSSTSVVNNDLIMVGGGASCYAFGTRFNQPIKINLCSLLDHSLSNVTSEKKTQCNTEFSDGLEPKYVRGLSHSVMYQHAKYAVLHLEKKYAKLAKDILKKFRWLDLERRVEASHDGCHILLPISLAFFEKISEVAKILDSSDGLRLLESFIGKFSLNEICFKRALNILLACGTSIHIDNKVCRQKIHRYPQKVLRDAVWSLMHSKGVPLDLLDQVPTRWQHVGDIVILPVNSFTDPVWNALGEDLWRVVADSLGAHRLARQGRILHTGTRDSTLEILVGDNEWVTHHENGIAYSFDATKCMFSSGNFSEKLRIAQVDCKDEVIVDLFAGIGYFVLPFLVRAKARFVYACEWNPHAIEALRYNLKMNSVADRCQVLEGDNLIMAPKCVADRVCLGLLPSSERSWLTAVRALRPEGGILHIHGNVKDSEEEMWTEYTVRSIHNMAKLEGHHWEVSLQHLERVKWYGPHVRHLVADVKCKAL